MVLPISRVVPLALAPSTPRVLGGMGWAAGDLRLAARAVGWGQHVIIEWGLVLDWWGSSSILWPQQSSWKSDTGYCRAGQTDNNSRLMQRLFRNAPNKQGLTRLTQASVGARKGCNVCECHHWEPMWLCRRLMVSQKRRKKFSSTEFQDHAAEHFLCP